jgi:class 3 adenylate cyclase
MPTFKTTYKEIIKNQKLVEIIETDVFNNFNEDILGLGKIDHQSKQVNALSVIFDLEGFTNFCKQIDPQLAVPEYLSQFLKWIFTEIKSELVSKKHDEGFETYSDLPFLSKYLGDGILFLWDTETMDEGSIRNVVVSMYEICENYQKKFLPKIVKSITSPPSKLRCGIARGAIYSVGNGSDFVGPCINMSARLQKLHSLSFCFSRRGIDLNQMVEAYAKIFIVKKVDIRGIGENELVCVLKNEFEKLEKSDIEKFKNI